MLLENPLSSSFTPYTDTDKSLHNKFRKLQTTLTSGTCVKMVKIMSTLLMNGKVWVKKTNTKKIKNPQFLPNHNETWSK